MEERLAVPSATDSLLRFSSLAIATVAAGSLAMIAGHPVAWLLYWVVAGLVLSSLAFAEHEAIHGGLFSGRWPNHVTGAICGALTAIPYSAYRSFHLQHHRRPHEEGDAEPATVLRNHFEQVLGTAGLMTGFAAALWWQLLRSVTGRPVHWSSWSRRVSLDVLTLGTSAVWIGLLVMLATLTSWTTAFAIWLAPLGVSLVIGGLLAVPEHYGAAYGPDSIFRTTRTIESVRPVRWLVWNGNYHTAHHAVPSVPGRNLDRLNSLISGRYEVWEPSYTSFHKGLWRQIAVGQLVPPPPWREDAPHTGSEELAGTNRNLTSPGISRRSNSESSHRMKLG